MSTALHLSWGGLIETMVTEFSENDLPENIKEYCKKLKAIEETKTIEEIRYTLHFTKNDLNYLNSPLLDEIFETIFYTDPIKLSIIKDKLFAFLFYYERTEKNEDTEAENLLDIGLYKSLRILEHFLKNKKIPDLEERIINNIKEVQFKPNSLITEQILLYLDYVPEITGRILDSIENNLEFFMAEKLVKKVSDRKLAERLLIRVYFPNNTSLVKTLLERFEHLPVKDLLNCYNPDVTLIKLVLQYSPEDAKEFIEVAFEEAIGNLNCNDVEFLMKEFNLVMTYDNAKWCFESGNKDVKSFEEFIEKFCDFNITLELLKNAISASMEHREILSKRLKFFYKNK